MMKDKSISTLKEEEKQGLLTIDHINELENDGRQGALQIASRIKRKEMKRLQLSKRWETMNELEAAAARRGFTRIAGIDEAGRGPLAGPVTAACVVLPPGFTLHGLDDSKKLPEKTRETYYEKIMAEAEVGVGEASAEEIDRMNIYQATRLAMKRAVLNMPSIPDYLLVDAMHIPVEVTQDSFVKGDERSVSIAAASVIAKVTRDRFMKRIDERYPEYQFEKNKGYGTKVHLEAIHRKGVTPYHRKSFVPVQS